MTKVNPIQLQKFLKGMDYPAKKEDLLNHAKQQGADDNVLKTLEQLTEEEYKTPTEVSQAVGNVQ